MEPGQLRPDHYPAGMEPIDVIDFHGLDFYTGNAIKYILRAGKKGGPEKEMEDLVKARTYIDFAIARLKRKQQNE